jgi:hypothetical protein
MRASAARIAAAVNLLALAAALFLAGILLVAGASKLRHPVRHARLLDGYELLPGGSGIWLAPALGVSEVLVATGLLLPSLRALSASLAFVILLLYSAAIAINLLRGRRDIDCGCGGLWGQQPLSAALLLRNAALMLCTLPPWLTVAHSSHALADWIVALAIAATAWITNTVCALYLARDALLRDD